MLEIKITAPELSEAINNLARALSARAETTPGGKTSGATPTGTTCVPANSGDYVPVPPVDYAAKSTPPAPPTPEGIAHGTQAPAATGAPLAVPVVPTADTSAPAAPVVPTAVPQYDLEMLAKAGTALIDAGKIGELMALLGKYGIEALTSLDPSKYGVFASELRALGAAI